MRRIISLFIACLILSGCQGDRWIGYGVHSEADYDYFLACTGDFPNIFVCPKSKDDKEWHILKSSSQW